MEGNIRRLESTLMMKTWKRSYFCLEDDKLVFYKSHQELEASDIIDLSKVTSVSNKPYKYAKCSATCLVPLPMATDSPLLAKLCHNSCLSTIS